MSGRLAALALALLVAAPADARAGEFTRVRLSPSLADRGMRITGVKPARASGRTLTLPVTGGPSHAIRHGGSFAWRWHGRVRRVGLVRLRLGARRSWLSGVVSGRRVTLLRFVGARRTADGVQRVRAARVEPTTAGARALGLRGVRTLGAADVAAIPDPERLRRPASAVDVTEAELTWHVRDSFIRYINAGEGTSVSGGARAGEPEVREGSDAPLVYTFRFPGRGGWFDPRSGRARIVFAGTVRFRWRAHGIDLRPAAPELELAGKASRAVFSLGGRRRVLADLDPDVAASSEGQDGATRTLTGIAAFTPAAAGASVFAGYYLAGDPFGSFDVAFTTR